MIQKILYRENFLKMFQNGPIREACDPSLESVGLQDLGKNNSEPMGQVLVQNPRFWTKSRKYANQILISYTFFFQQVHHVSISSNNSKISKKTDERIHIMAFAEVEQYIRQQTLI